jgi:uncharacterized protein (UPF0332 family)
MTINDEDKRSLIKHRLVQAEETIEDVRLLIKNNRLRSAVNRIYYGMFYSLLALGLDSQFNASKHTRLIGWFNKNFIHEGLLDARYGRIINKAFNRRNKGDYDAYVRFEKGIVIEMFDEMQEFIAAIKKRIEIN